MLRSQELEELLVENTGLFTTSQLASMLLAVCRETNKLAAICHKVSDQFKGEGSSLFDRRATAAETESGEVKLSQEVADVIKRWTEFLDELLKTAADLVHVRKYLLLQLALDLVAVMRPVAMSPTLLLLHQLVEMIVHDLKQRCITKRCFRDFSICLQKLSRIDRQSHGQLVAQLGKDFVAVTSHDDCLEIFLDEADHLSPEAAELFFTKAVEAFSTQQAVNSWINKIPLLNWLRGSGTSDAKTQNLARLFSHCIQETQLPGRGSAEVFAVIIDMPVLANMMKFLPQLRRLGCLPAEIERKASLILNHVKQVTLDLADGRLSLHLLGMLKHAQQRVDRLVALAGIMEESPQSSGDLKTLVGLRLGELAEYHQAGEDIRSFSAKFDDLKDSDGVSETLAQFAGDPSTVELREVCELRSRMGPIQLHLHHVSVEDLKQVRRHQDLYASAAFRIIQDRVLLHGETGRYVFFCFLAEL